MPPAINNTYSPTAHPVSVRALVVLAMINAKLNKPVYLYPPKGFYNGGRVIKLKCALY